MQNRHTPKGSDVVFACVLVMVRNKSRDNRSPFPAQNRKKVFDYLLLCIEEIFISLDEHGGSKASQTNLSFTIRAPNGGCILQFRAYQSFVCNLLSTPRCESQVPSKET